MSTVGRDACGEMCPTSFRIGPFGPSCNRGHERPPTGAKPIGSQPRFRAYGRRHLNRIPQLRTFSRHQMIGLQVASTVLPFRVNDSVLLELIDWSNIPADPIYQLNFPQAEMLDHEDFVALGPSCVLCSVRP